MRTMNQGRVLLLEELRHTTQRELARRSGLSKTTIARFASGEAIDSYQKRSALLRSVGIPLEAWDRSI